MRAEATYSPIITIQTGKPGITPIFCVPGAGANVTCFLAMAHAIGEHAPIYGLQPRGLDGILVPHSSVSTAARAYIESIRMISPNGAFRLVGHSFGGWVVFEMALQLIDAGEVVETVVILDTSPPSVQSDRRRQYDRIDAIMELVRILEMACDQSLCLTAIEFESLNEDEQLTLLLQRMIRVKLVHRDCKLRTIRGMLRVFTANINTCYIPKFSFLGDVVLVQAKDIAEQSPSDSDDPVAVWQMYAPNLTTLNVSANHVKLLEKPYIDMLTQYLLGLWNN